MRLRWLLLLAFVIVSACTARDPSANAGTQYDDSIPERGGTLTVVGNEDIDHLSPPMSALIDAYALYRTFTRQLVAYPADPDFDRQSKPVPDIAVALPTRENGGISADGKTYTFHMRRGVRWNTQPPRDVTAHDMARGIKMLCNPVIPTFAPAYFTGTIRGFAQFCTAFVKVAALPAEIRRFVEAHEIEGVRVADDTTIVFTLTEPATDFLNILAIPAASPMPVEYLDVLPDGPEARRHTISNGPYQITRYVPNREYVLERNPAWDARTDDIRKASVDRIEIALGAVAQSAHQQVQTGAADLRTRGGVPTAELPLLIAARDPNLLIGPLGDVYAMNYMLMINHLSPNADGALRKPLVRKALEYAVDRAAVLQLLGGPAMGRPLHQVAPAGSAGTRPDYDPYPTPGDRGDAVKAKVLLAEAGYPNGVTLKLAIPSDGESPRIAQTIQANVSKAGIRIEIMPATFEITPDNTRRGLWDMTLWRVWPDWYGNNGRAWLQAFDGRAYGVNSMNVGDYNNEDVNRLIDLAFSAPTDSAARHAWQKVATRIIEEAAVVPLVEMKGPVYHSTRTRNCVYMLATAQCDMTALWLKGAAPRARP